jgi:glyoxalase family protein
MKLTGLHHVTAITADAVGNHDFYTRVLGMRMVKKTVNQDDVSAYHLFYADAEARPGTDLTFFDWPVGRERRGSHAISGVGLRVAGDSLDAWAGRLAAAGAHVGAIAVVDGRATLAAEDPEGQRLILVDDGGAGDARPWGPSPVPAAEQIRGLGPVWLSVPDPEPTARFLTGVLGMERSRDYALDVDGRERRATVYAMGAGGPAAEVHLVATPDLAAAEQGAGAVHHVAFRVSDDEEYRDWLDYLKRSRVPTSGAVDRFWFKSIYMREPNGILIELATDGPGFTVDEPLEHLGERLVLPPKLEPRRAAIEAGLKPLP